MLKACLSLLMALVMASSPRKISTAVRIDRWIHRMGTGIRTSCIVQSLLAFESWICFKDIHDVGGFHLFEMLSPFNAIHDYSRTFTGRFI